MVRRSDGPDRALEETDPRLSAVLQRAEELLRETATTKEAADLLIEPLRDLRASADPRRHFPAAAHLPLLVYESLTGEWRGAVPLACATTLVFAGINVLDDAMDGDTTRFGRQDGVEEQWRIVADAIASPTRVRTYPPGSAGPSHVG